MKVIISPAKSLDFETAPPTLEYSKPRFVEKTTQIHQVLKTKSVKKISELMNLSDKLSLLNWQRYQDFGQANSQTKAAIFTFHGDVYLGLDSYTLKPKQITLLQEKIRILSGFYGLLRPLDLISAHRLEMGTKLKIGKKENLYQFWRETITQSLAQELTKQEPLINLASQEYFQVIQKKKINNLIITPIFQDYKNGQYKVISFFTKKARGMMVRFLLDKNIKKSEDLKNFHYGNYKYYYSTSNFRCWVFRRKA